jgi:hypothetical protein
MTPSAFGRGASYGRRGGTPPTTSTALALCRRQRIGSSGFSTPLTRVTQAGASPVALGSISRAIVSSR